MGGELEESEEVPKETVLNFLETKGALELRSNRLSGIDLFKDPSKTPSIVDSLGG